MPNLFRHLLNYVYEVLFRQEVLKQVQDDEERKPELKRKSLELSMLTSIVMPSCL